MGIVVNGKDPFSQRPSIEGEFEVFLDTKLIEVDDDEVSENERKEQGDEF